MGLPIAICSSNAPQRTPIPSPSFPPPGWGPWEMVTAMSSTPIAAEPRGASFLRYARAGGWE